MATHSDAHPVSQGFIGAIYAEAAIHSQNNAANYSDEREVHLTRALSCWGAAIKLGVIPE